MIACQPELRRGVRDQVAVRTREQAQEHLTTAATMYREMNMRFWLEQAER